MYINKVMSLKCTISDFHDFLLKATTYVKRLKYRAVTTPYLCLVHSVRTNPSGHFFLMIGPRIPNTSSGKDEDKV